MFAKILVGQVGDPLEKCVFPDRLVSGCGLLMIDDES